MLTQEQRELAERHLKRGDSQQAIAEMIGVHPSSISRLKKRLAGLQSQSSTTETLSFRVSTNEAQTFERAATRSHFDKTRSAFLRRLMRRALGFFESDDDTAHSLVGLESNLLRIGGNINQIARDLSASRRTTGRASISDAQFDAITELGAELARLRRLQRHLLTRSQERSAALLARLDEQDDVTDG